MIDANNTILRLNIKLNFLDIYECIQLQISENKVYICRRQLWKSGISGNAQAIEEIFYFSIFFNEVSNSEKSQKFKMLTFKNYIRQTKPNLILMLPINQASLFTQVICHCLNLVSSSFTRFQPKSFHFRQILPLIILYYH